MIVGLKGSENIVRFIIKIEYKGAGFPFAGIGSVQARQRLHALHAAERFIHVHGAQLRLVKAGLELVGHQHHLIVIGIKRLTHIAAFERRVHIDFSKFLVQQRKAVHVIFLKLNFA